MLRHLASYIIAAVIYSPSLVAQNERPPDGPRPVRPGGEGQPPNFGERPLYPPREGGGRGQREDEHSSRSGAREGQREGDRPSVQPDRLVKKPTPYLGVVTNTAPAALATQFGLTEGFGLVVEEVLPDSPAQAAGLQRHDLLTLLGEQQLAAPGQLAALVRAAGKEKEVSLTLIRKTETKKMTVKVGETLLPERAYIDGGGGGGVMTQPRTTLPFLNRGSSSPGERGPRENARPSDLLREMRPGSDRPAGDPFGGGASRWDSNRARVTMRDREGELELTVKDGQRTLVAKNVQGEVIHSGPVDTPAQRDALPAPLRARLAALEAAPKQDELRRPQRSEPPSSSGDPGVQ